MEKILQHVDEGKSFSCVGSPGTGKTHILAKVKERIEHINLQNFEQSLVAFNQAKKVKSSAKTAKQWFHYVEKEQGAKQKLAMLN